MAKQIQTAGREIGQLSPLLFDLQTHFLQIKTLAETHDSSANTLKDIRLLSKHALEALDYTMFAIDALQTELPLTNVSAGAAATEVAENLRMFAKAYNVEIELEITKKLEPIFANDAAIKGTLYGLVSSLITAVKKTDSKTRIIIAAQETAPTTQRIGVYSPGISLHMADFKLAKGLISQARSLAPDNLHGAGLGLLISDQLTRAMGSQLRRFNHRGIRGVGFYMPISTQLSFIK